MSWVDHSIEGDREVFRVCCEEMNDDHDSDKFQVAEFIDTLYEDVCGDKVCLEKDSMESYEICKEIIGDLLLIFDDSNDKVLEKKPPTKFQCVVCDRGFKDNAHLKEHKVRMHSEPTACMICNVIYPDKHSAILHQTHCFRKCQFDHCSYQTRHKHKFMQHVRGHEQKLRRFTMDFSA